MPCTTELEEGDWAKVARCLPRHPQAAVLQTAANQGELRELEVILGPFLQGMCASVSTICNTCILPGGCTCCLSMLHIVGWML
jgi:hypothetical protein